MLVREGFIRPIWFTTGRTTSDAGFETISTGAYHRACAKSEVLAHTDYGGFFSGIMKKDFEDAAIGARIGVLVVGFPEVVAQIAVALPRTVVFALKGIDRSEQLILADQHLIRLRMRLRLAWHAELLTEPQALYLLGLADDIGRQIGGWQKRLARAS